jgi:hypothetical protein
MTRPSPLRTRLTAIAPERARLQTAVIAALNSREVEGLTTTARLANARDRRAATTWIDFESSQGRVAVAPLLVDGTLAQLTRGSEPDGVAAAATLERIEPLIAAAETALGVALQPHGLSATVDEADNVLFRLDGHLGQGIAHRLIVAVPEGLQPSPLPLPLRIPAFVTRLKPVWRGRIAGPAIPARRRATLAAGDLILLGAGILVAKLSLPGAHGAFAARLNWGEKRLVVEQDRGGVAMDAAADGATGGSTDWGNAALPSTIEFDGRGLTSAELAGIGEGSVLPLPAQGGTIAVRVRIGGEIFCSGELVAVGEGFGVLVTGVSASPSDPA